MMRTVHLRASRDDVLGRLRQLPAMAAGRTSEGREASRGLALRLGVVTMSFLKEAFIIKARGGVDAAGEKWAPLSPVTIRKRLSKGRLGKKQLPLKVRRALERFIAAKAEYIKAAKRAGGFKKAKQSTMDKANAKVRRLEAKLKKYKARLEKAETELQTAIAGIEILRDTGRMFNSLSPGESGQLNADGVLVVNPGEIVFGTNVEYAADHMTGRDGSDGQPKMPARPLWPDPEKWPSDWWRQIGQAAGDGLLDMAVGVLTGTAQ